MAAELPTAHISHLQQARWFHTGGPWSLGRDTIPLTNVDFYSAPGPIHACAPAAWRPGRNAKTPWIGVNAVSVPSGGCIDYKEYLFTFGVTIRRFCLTLHQTDVFIC